MSSDGSAVVTVEQMQAKATRIVEHATSRIGAGMPTPAGTRWSTWIRTQRGSEAEVVCNLSVTPDLLQGDVVLQVMASAYKERDRSIAHARPVWVGVVDEATDPEAMAAQLEQVLIGAWYEAHSIGARLDALETMHQDTIRHMRMAARTRAVA